MADFSNINIQDMEDGKDKDFYQNFKEKLIDVEQFPTVYKFKFIVKSDLNKEPEIEKIFTHTSSKFSFKESSGGKYKSITVETFVNNADEVVNYYKAVSRIESVIML
ncbi:DUF493 family protein [Sphingobacterium corticis]|uniref:DUF493 family protein n=1 Tax=Sphingobacterium corticis TaxID=1812823 RepID=A0ABW5NLB0_9SPHI